MTFQIWKNLHNVAIKWVIEVAEKSHSENIREIV